MTTEEGVTTGKFIAGIVIAILVASAVSRGVAAQFSKKEKKGLCG